VWFGFIEIGVLILKRSASAVTAIDRTVARVWRWQERLHRSPLVCYLKSRPLMSPPQQTRCLPAHARDRPLSASPLLAILAAKGEASSLRPVVQCLNPQSNIR